MPSLANPYSSKDPTLFVSWLRKVAPYIHELRNKTFVVAIPGELIEAGKLNYLVHDLSLLHVMGIHIAVAYGSRPQINKQLSLRSICPKNLESIRVTDPISMECVKEAVGRIRLDIEATFSQGLPNTPMANASIRVISGNFITAKPVGIIQGTDYLYTGLTRKVDTVSILSALSSGAIVLLSPLGYSPTGETFNLTLEDVATQTAIALKADKLIFLSEFSGVPNSEGRLIGEISEQQATHMLSCGTLPKNLTFTLQHALLACRNGVERAHIIPSYIDGSVLLEIFQHEGIGTMLVKETLESLREATTEDIGSILSLITPMEEEGTLVRRDRFRIEQEINNFTVIEHDRVIFGCGALYPFTPEQSGEVACLAVHPNKRNQGEGKKLLSRLEKRAKTMKLEKIFVLTTQTSHWFLKQGFVETDVHELPRKKQGLYNWSRKSKVLVKKI